MFQVCCHDHAWVIYYQNSCWLSKQGSIICYCIWSATVCISKIGAMELEKKLPRKVICHHDRSTAHWNGSSKNHWRLVERFRMELSFIWSRYSILRDCRFFPSRCSCYKNQKWASLFLKKTEYFLRLQTWQCFSNCLHWFSLRFHLNFRSLLLLYTFWWKRLIMITPSKTKKNWNLLMIGELIVSDCILNSNFGH